MKTEFNVNNKFSFINDAKWVQFFAYESYSNFYKLSANNNSAEMVKVSNSRGV